MRDMRLTKTGFLIPIFLIGWMSPILADNATFSKFGVFEDKSVILGPEITLWPRRSTAEAIRVVRMAKNWRSENRTHYTKEKLLLRVALRAIWPAQIERTRGVDSFRHLGWLLTPNRQRVRAWWNLLFWINSPKTHSLNPLDVHWSGWKPHYMC